MKRILLLGGVALVLLAAAGYGVWRSYVPHKPLSLDESARVERCEKHLEAILGLHMNEQSSSAAGRSDATVDQAELALLSNLASRCYTEVDEEDTLSEAAIRRLAFLNQQSAMPLLMWMVIAVTLSGVGLACLQLVASYRLALQGKAVLEQRSEVSIEASRISTNSSVSGVSILLISLAFFYIFVKHIYLISDTTLEGAPVGKSAPVAPLQPGGIGPLPPHSAVDPTNVRK